MKNKCNKISNNNIKYLGHIDNILDINDKNTINSYFILNYIVKWEMHLEINQGKTFHDNCNVLKKIAGNLGYAITVFREFDAGHTSSRCRGPKRFIVGFNREKPVIYFYSPNHYVSCESFDEPSQEQYEIYVLERGEK